MEAPKLIPVGSDFAIVDAADHAFLSQWDWVLSDNGYACRTITVAGKCHVRFMHRVVTDAPDGTLTDHINGNKLDNRRSNLRLATPRQNSLNRNANEKRARGVSFKGVYSNPNCGTFTARITAHKKHIYLGSFKDQESAARAYDAKAKELFGDFARLNFPEV